MAEEMPRLWAVPQEAQLSREGWPESGCSRQGTMSWDFAADVWWFGFDSMIVILGLALDGMQGGRGEMKASSKTVLPAYNLVLLQS